MAYFIRGMGVFFYPMLVIAAAVAVLVVRKAVDLGGSKQLPPYRLEKGLHAILFWGIVALLLGVLGQHMGMYNALSVISRAAELSPQVIAMGLAQSISTTIFGLLILIVSAIAWFVLYTRWRARIAQK